MTATATTLGPGLLPGFAERPGTPDIPPMPVVGSARVRSLDGLRAIAVTAVIGFHLGVGWLPGGLLGVDMFFVLSGFLITSLLVTERDRTGRISLKGFYNRRARRLLPAMLLVLIVTLVVWRLTADPSRFPGLRGDATATLGYVANWHFAFSGQGYFDQLAPPSPLLHLWSLAVEEQFYLVWPLVVIITLRFGSRRLLLAVAMAGAAASTALISVLSVRGVDANRLYYGTDTRATAVLVGAALALAAPTLVRAAARPRARLAILATGLVAATSLVLIMTHTGGQDAWLYRGGFLAVALAVGAVIGASVAAPTSPFARLLACPPLPYLGRISYGLYLWHWPVTLWLTHSRTGLSGPALLGVRLAVTLACAMASWHFLEQPILRGTLRVPAPRITAPAVLAAAAVVLVALPPPGVAAATAGVADSDVARLRTLPPAPPGQGPKMLVEGDSVALTLAADLAVAAADPANRQHDLHCARQGQDRMRPQRARADHVAWGKRPGAGLLQDLGAGLASRCRRRASSRRGHADRALGRHGQDDGRPLGASRRRPLRRVPGSPAGSGHRDSDIARRQGRPAHEPLFRIWGKAGRYGVARGRPRTSRCLQPPALGCREPPPGRGPGL